MQEWIARLFSGQINKAVSAELAKRGDPKPATTEIPPGLVYSQMFLGGAKKKYGSAIDFETLRAFSVVYDVARACINYRKRQIDNLEWAIVPVNEKADQDKFKRQIEIATAFFKKPSNGETFKTWLDKLMEDILVLDAGVLWKDKTFGGTLTELVPVDGATIRLKINEDGTLPEPPEGAYQQIIYGEIKGEYTIEEMYYKMMNPRNNTPYGLSPIETLIISIESAMRSQIFNSSMLSEGNIPEGFYTLPDTWTPEQIKEFQIWFDSMMAGNAATTTRIKFMPGGKGVGYIPTKKPEDMRMLEFEKWLLLKTCAVFDVQPESVGFIENVTSTTATGQREFGNERGLVPTANFLKELFTEVVQKDLNLPQLKFEWKGLQSVDDDFELERARVMVQTGAMTINEMRVAQGMDPYTEDVANKPLVFTAGGPVLLEMAEEEPETEPVNDSQEVDDNENDELEEMDKWEKKALKFFKQGKSTPDFETEYIDAAARSLISARLHVAKSKEEIKSAFKPFRDEVNERLLIKQAMSVKDKISKFKRSKYEKTR